MCKSQIFSSRVCGTRGLYISVIASGAQKNLTGSPNTLKLQAGAGASPATTSHQAEQASPASLAMGASQSAHDLVTSVVRLEREPIPATDGFWDELMGATFTGLAARAFELAHAYAHERKQGGVPIIRHQSVAHRLFHMYRKVEASRALTRRVVTYNTVEPQPALHAAMTSKVTGTQTAFEVASDARQIFGGNGMTREYPMEKLLRDARASMIEDGCNEILAIKGGYALADRSLL